MTDETWVDQVDQARRLRDRLASLPAHQRAVLERTLRERNVMIPAAVAPPLHPAPAAPRTGQARRTRRPASTMDFSVMFFSGDGSVAGPGKYQLLLDSARRADQLGFAGIWVPERHFVDFGGLYPNPSVLAAALAVVTERIQIRAGSVVLPLHHPVRVAEEWAVVDNLSGGRIAISAASGWHPGDFLLAPGDGRARYPRRKEEMFEALDAIQRLWAGETVELPWPDGTTSAVRTLPRPVQPRLPVWISAAGSPETFERAGRLGAAVLTGLVGQRPEDLKAKIGTYRAALREAGHDPALGRVAAMAHTHLGDDDDEVRRRVQGPLIGYLRTFLAQQDDTGSQFATLTAAERDVMLATAFERYHDGQALLGTPDRCEAVVEDLVDIGVDEVACLVDFGVAPDAVLSGLDHLAVLRDRYRNAGLDGDLTGRLARLSPAQRALLDRRLRDRTSTPAALSHIPRRQRPDRARLTVDQERIWLIHQFDPADPAYNVFFASRLLGDLDVTAVERAVDRFVARHEAMRTTFALDGLTPVQVVHEHVAVPVVLRDLRDVPAARREAEMLRLATAESRVPFDVAAGPLLRITLLRLAEREHVLVGVVDHLVWDRASMGIFNREFAQLYNACAAGGEPALPPVELHYPDYAEWQPRWLHEEVARKHLPYWLERLAGADLVLELPADRPRPPVQTFHGARHQFRLTAELTLAVRELARREDVTVNVALLAAWQLLLHLLTGQRDIVVGTTASTRSRPETEPMIGYFLTMLPLRTTITPNVSVQEVLRACRATMIGAFDHHDIPFGTLLDALGTNRDPSRTPVYQSSFILVDFRHEDPEPMTGLEVEELMLDNGTAKDDITAGFFDDPTLGGNAFFGLLEYNTDLFDASTIERMCGQLQRVLEQMVAGPTGLAGDLSLLSADERHTLLTGWNDTAAARGPGVTVVDLLRRTAGQHPGAVAASCGGQRLSYAGLVDRVDQLADHLRQRGVRDETVVGVCLERSLDLLVALLGVLAAGGAYLPLDPGHPAQRLAGIAADASAELVITSATLLEALAGCPGGRICLDRDAAAIAAEPAGPPAPRPGGERLAYVIYTSGSTGHPKGVQVTHRNLVNLLLDLTGRIGFGPADVLAAVTPVTFDIAGLELYGPLVAGARVELVPQELAQDGPGLAGLLDRAGVTIMQATPATWHLLAEAGWRNDGQLRVLVGGEALPPALAAQLVTGPGRTWNVYGPTETTIWSTAHLIDDGTAPVSIGRPLANTQAYVLDERLRPVPAGVPGDLYLGGDGVARGYRGLPGLTAGRFLPDHLSGRSGARMYATGDRARWRPDGTLTFLGRDDGQVKVRGFRIEPGEIEHRLEQHPAVRRAVVLVREDRPGDRRLVAYVTGEGVPLAGLRDHLRGYLPDYMVPGTLVPLPEFPLTTSGKVDRRALPAPAAHHAGRAHVPPRDPVELAVARIWEDVLGVRPVGVTDQFFDLGGHSLLVLRLVVEIEKRFGTRLPMAAIFQGATVESFARMLREGYQPPAGAHLLELSPGGAGVPVFFAHPAGSEVVCYRSFAGLLPGDHPLYALASPPAENGELPFASFEDRARQFAGLIRQVRPHGPYALAGWCYGGANAFAVARELEAAGERVSVTVIDSHLPDLAPGEDEPDRAEIIAAIAVNLQWDYGPNLKTVDELRGMSGEEHLDYLLGIARSADYLPSDAGRAQIAEVVDVWLANLRLLWRYRPTPIASPVTVIRARDEEHDPSGRWREMAAGAFSRHEIDGNHYTVMRSPRVGAVAELISEMIARLDGDRPQAAGEGAGARA